jgi:hypothetical protein
MHQPSLLTVLNSHGSFYCAGGASEGREGHPGGHGPLVGHQDALLLPGPRQPLPHHGVPP